MRRGRVCVGGGAVGVPGAPAVELRGVSFGYGRGGRAASGGRLVLRDVSVAFPRGAVSVLLGPNGCGKSTLVRCVARGAALASGEALVQGRPVAELSSRERARLVAVMPQGADAPDMEVVRLVSGGRFPHHGLFGALDEHDRRAVREAMERAGCLALAGRSVRSLSGGERQRAYLAMVLAQGADVVMLDEPTAFMDPGAAFGLARIARELASSGTGVIMVLHDIPLAMACADYVAVLRDGAIRAFGTPQDVARTGVIDEAFGVRLRRATIAGETGIAGESAGEGWCLLPAR